MDPLEAALSEAFAGTDNEATSTAKTKEEKPKPAEGENLEAGEGEADGENAEGKTTEEEEATLTDEELEAAMPENSDDIDPETPPKGLEKVPKPVWQRIVKQSAQIRDLKAQMAEGMVTIQPTPSNPLADVGTIEELDGRIEQARADRDWARKNPDGGMRKRGGKEVEVSAEDAAEMLTKAESLIDADANTRMRITQREQSKPWAKAQAIVPAMFEAGTQEHTFTLNVLQQCPDIATKIPEWEYFVACAAKGMKQVVEESSKRAKYVRYELDKDGKIIPPKKPAGEGSGKGAENKPKPPPATPSAARPPIKPASASTQKSDQEVLAGMPANSTSDDRLDALLRNAFGGS